MDKFTPNISLGTFPGFKNLFYKEIQCKPEDVENNFMVLAQSLHPVLAAQGCDVEYWAIYPDNVDELINPEDMRVIIGLVVQTDFPEDEADKICLNHDGIMHRNVPSGQALYTMRPLLSA